MIKPKKTDQSGDTPENTSPPPNLPPVDRDDDDVVDAASPLTPPPVDRDDDDVVDAASLGDSAPRERARDLTMQRKFFFLGQPTLVRLITSKLVRASVHEFVKVGDSMLHLQCNGDPCVPCLAKLRLTRSLLLPVYFHIAREVGVIDFDELGGSGSLRAQIIPLLQQKDFTDLLVEIEKLDSRRYRVAIIKKLDDSRRGGADYGDDVLRDLAARGGPQARDVRAVIDRRDNQTLLSQVSMLRQTIRDYLPGRDLSKL